MRPRGAHVGGPKNVYDAGAVPLIGGMADLLKYSPATCVTALNLVTLLQTVWAKVGGRKIFCRRLGTAP